MKHATVKALTDKELQGKFHELWTHYPYAIHRLEKTLEMLQRTRTIYRDHDKEAEYMFTDEEVREMITLLDDFYVRLESVFNPPWRTRASTKARKEP